MKTTATTANPAPSAPIQAIQVFCGARVGADPAFAQAAKALGELLARQGIRLVFGGGHVGLMGVLADAVLEHGGYAVGVIPDFLVARELGHPGIQEMIVVKSMHERKLEMAARSDATIALPGGFGTMDELFEVLTMIQLGQSTQPIGILNVNGFYDPLLAQLQHMRQEGLLKEIHRQLLVTAPEAPELIRLLNAFSPAPAEGKWDITF